MNPCKLAWIAVFPIVALIDSPVYSQAPPALPQGMGLAAAYPNDSGLAANANVIFVDGFENYTSLSQLTGSGNYTNYYQGSNLAFDTSTFFGGTKALRISMPATGNEVSNAVMKRLSPSRDVLFMRVYTRFQDNYAGLNSAHNGVRISGNYTGPGRRPNGTDFFSVSIENSKWGSEAEPGYSHAYVYHPEQDDVYGEHWFSDGTTSNGAQSFGQYFVARPKAVAPRGVWLCFEVLVQMNTPGSRNGRVAVWQNGTLIADWQSVRFRDVNTVKIDEINFENGGQGSTQRNDKWYDNLVLATQYIGPIATGTVPSPPTDLRIAP